MSIVPYTPSLVHLLPNELLSNIFLCTCKRLSIPGPCAEDVEHLKAVSAVCSFWRNIAISTPNLWNNITYHSNKERTPKSITHQIETFLRRSRNTPLDLYLTMKDEIYLRKIRNLVLPHAFRWPSFHLSVNDARMFRQFVPLPDSLEQLVDLNISIPFSLRFEVIMLDLFPRRPAYNSLRVVGLREGSLLPRQELSRPSTSLVFTCPYHVPQQTRQLWSRCTSYLPAIT